MGTGWHTELLGDWGLPEGLGYWGHCELSGDPGLLGGLVVTGRAAMGTWCSSGDGGLRGDWELLGNLGVTGGLLGGLGVTGGLGPQG